MKSSDDFHVRLKNFQSIKDGDLTFPSGVTVVVGQSNSGKTAILRAIKSNILNPPRTQRFISHGESETSVEIDYLDNTFEWSRNNSGCKYIINGEEYRKLGSSDLFDYLKDNGFIVDEKGNLMNLEGENQILFPFDKSPQELFKLFENLLSVLQSSGVIKQFKLLEDSRSTEASNLESEIFKVSNKINTINSLKEIVSLEKLKNSKNSLTSLAEKKQTISADITEIRNNIRIMRATKIENRDIPESKLEEYLALLSDLTNIKNVIKLCKGFNPPKCDRTNLLDKYNELMNIIKASKIMKVTNIEVNKINNTFDLNTYIELRKDILELKDIRSKALEIKGRTSEIEKELKEIKEELGSFKVCPLCGHTLEE